MAATETAEVFAARSRANSCAAGSTSSAGSAREKSPISAPSVPEKIRPDSSSSIARDTPTSRGSIQLAPASGTRPRLVNTKPYLASAAANRMSQLTGKVMPMPTAEPFIAAITGVRIWTGASRSAAPPPASAPSAPSGRANVAPPPPRSAPAEKYLPAPVTTMARTPSSASNRANASCSSRVMSAEKELRRSGRFSQIVATLPDTSVRRVW